MSVRQFVPKREEAGTPFDVWACENCGAREATEGGKYPPGWAVEPEHGVDLCPECQG